MSPPMSASPMRGNRDESETRPDACRSQDTLPRLQENRLFDRRHPPPMRDRASRPAPGTRAPAHAPPSSSAAAPRRART